MSDVLAGAARDLEHNARCRQMRPQRLQNGGAIPGGGRREQTGIGHFTATLTLPLWQRKQELAHHRKVSPRPTTVRTARALEGQTPFARSGTRGPPPPPSHWHW